MKLEDIKVVGMAGAGSMGAGIAQVAAMAGLQVKVVDVSDAVWGRAEKTITKSLERIVKKGTITEDEMKAVLGRISFSTDVSTLKDVPFIFEAVFEDLGVKKELFAKLDAVCGDDTIYATNTSSIAITEMAALVKRPAKFVGMHFFNPVPMMKLVEVIPALQTAVETKDLALAMAKKIGKTAITCKDTPGFVVNRLFVPYIIDAVRLLEEGVASAEDIDTAMKLGCNMPMGPLEFQDFAGVDIGYHVINIFHDYMKQERFAAPGLLRNMIKAGYVGRKAGKGFYDYSEEK
ncbi:3-hydroxyacyl-CoA dehydrogenase family protein [Geobacter argillaceus]|uniref:3-hydroxyacyl-CoA dehydrogenase n=2 Tax=Geobacter argillaceus TaxID=345631 RepID=A0A562V708_9BACT|nr:3-hydroxyacyl-CoA dehydrogenase family protein [Geobacter argillaceus]TWJ13663.1 3-hydroxyacyl-CoA dehydrogenase [Geobacter argillaceus]